jgi:hypothetical protein
MAGTPFWLRRASLRRRSARERVTTSQGGSTCMLIQDTFLEGRDRDLDGPFTSWHGYDSERAYRSCTASHLCIISLTLLHRSDKQDVHTFLPILSRSHQANPQAPTISSSISRNEQRPSASCRKNRSYDHICGKQTPFYPHPPNQCSDRV